MKIGIFCETSGALRRRFRDAGHDAWSFDLLPAEDGETEFHVIGDAIEAAYGQKWDMGIFHPSCTYLTSSGLHWNHRVPGRAEKTEHAITFACKLWEAPIRRKVLENPIGRLGPVMLERYGIRPQIIQPNQFGDDASKATCLWLHNVPPLRPTRLASPRFVNVNGHDLLGQPIGTPRWSNQTDSGQNKLAPSADRWKDRSRTYPGLAEAAVAQWGNL